MRAAKRFTVGTDRKGVYNKMEFKFSNRISGVQGSAIREIFKYGNRPEVISLAGGNPAPELFPSKEFAEILAEILAKNRRKRFNTE